MNNPNDLSLLESSILDCNKYAIEALHENDYSIALELLRKAKKLVQTYPKGDKSVQLKAITYNNIGCFYKKQNNYKKSLTYLTQALSYELHLPKEVSSIAGTYLNISKIYSDLREHEKSLSFALKAVKAIEDTFKNKVSVISSLVIAYQLAGNQYFFLGQKTESKIFLSQSYELSLKYFGVSSDLTKELEKDLRKIKNERNLNNPTIDKMIGYFEKHLGAGKYSYSKEVSGESISSRGRNNKKMQSLQPIVSTEAKGKTTRKMYYSESPRKAKALPYLTKNPENKKPRAQVALSKFSKNLSMFKGSKAPSPKLHIIPKKKSLIESILYIQKNFKGYLARKRYKLLRSRQKVIQFLVRCFLRQRKPSKRPSYFPKISQASSKTSVQTKHIQTNINPMKKRSFLEKIIFLQYHIRKFLKSLKTN